MQLSKANPRLPPVLSGIDDVSDAYAVAVAAVASIQHRKFHRQKVALWDIRSSKRNDAIFRRRLAANASAIRPVANAVVVADDDVGSCDGVAYDAVVVVVALLYEAVG